MIRSDQDRYAPVLEKLVDCWGTARFIDAGKLNDEPMPGGRHPLEWLVGEAEALGLELVPVVGPEHSVAYISAAAAVIRRHARDVCLRLPVAAWPEVSGPTAFGDLLKALGTSTSNAHLVLDLQDEKGPAAVSLAATQLRSIWTLGNWRSVTLIGTG